MNLIGLMRALSSSARFGVFLLSGWLLAGCGREDIRVRTMCVHDPRPIRATHRDDRRLLLAIVARRDRERTLTDCRHAVVRDDRLLGHLPDRRIARRADAGESGAVGGAGAPADLPGGRDWAVAGSR